MRTLPASLESPNTLGGPAFAYGNPLDLGTLSGGNSNAWAINLNEEIVGNSDGMPVIWLGKACGDNGQPHAMLWT